MEYGTLTEILCQFIAGHLKFVIDFVSKLFKYVYYDSLYASLAICIPDCCEACYRIKYDKFHIII